MHKCLLYMLVVSIFLTLTACISNEYRTNTSYSTIDTSNVTCNITSSSIESENYNSVDLLLHTVLLTNGQTKEIFLPYSALNHIREFHADIDGDGHTDIVIAYRDKHGTAVYVENIRIISGYDGHEIQIPSVTETLDSRMSIVSIHNGWDFMIDNQKYSVLTEQFGNSPEKQQIEIDGNPYYLEKPIYHFQQRFFTENNELYCEVLLVCNHTYTDFAKEAIYLHFYFDGTNCLNIDQIHLQERRSG